MVLRVWSLVFFSLLLATSAFSQPEMRFRPGWGMKCWSASDLNLSLDQARELDAVQQSYLKETQHLRADLFSKRLELRDLLTNPGARAETIRAKHGEIEGLQSRLEERMIEYLIKARSILTADQLKMWCPQKEFSPFHRMR